MPVEKKTEKVYVWLSEALELELRRLADVHGTKLSEFIGVVLRRHVYGHAIKFSDTVSGEQENE